MKNFSPIYIFKEPIHLEIYINTAMDNPSHLDHTNHIIVLVRGAQSINMVTPIGIASDPFTLADKLPWTKSYYLVS